MAENIKIAGGENENLAVVPEKTVSLPMVALKGLVMFPDVTSAFDAGRSKSLLSLSDAANTDNLVFIASQIDKDVDDPTPEQIYNVGVVCRIKRSFHFENAVSVHIEGLYRAEIIEYLNTDDRFTVEVRKVPAVYGDENEVKAAFQLVKSKLRAAIDAGEADSVKKEKLSQVKDIDKYINIAMFCLDAEEEEKQRVLQTTSVIKRAELFVGILIAGEEIKKAERRINDRVRESVEKGQKEYYLREQLKAIHQELGDDENEKDELRQKILDKHMPAEVEEKALKELSRMSKMSTSLPDYSVLRTYLDWILDLPFGVKSPDCTDINQAEKVLNADHYGLEKVKTRILEYLSVMKLTGKIGGSILCLVGPPGVGKTSVASSVARALGRKFVRMSLGGVKDEAEIRGHRKTYIGAIPGRIIYGIKDAGTCNPVFLLDEIDKISSDLRGDPASALLEVLDPEQNATFRDRYLEVPFDLSDVLFITTANTLETIPGPLLDRMEVIELSGYTREEKAEIAKRYLIGKQKKANGLEKIDVTFSESAVNGVIDGYTREAGVRNLEREIGTICRKIACDVAKNGEKGKYKITETNLPKYLGIRKYLPDDTDLGCEVGSATGLAWTAVGGTTLTIEVALTPGKGEILLTGKLGDVMKESARAAISYLHANAEKFGINEELFGSRNIHIHVPEGATPKDGPSAGITMATALFSAFSGKAVNKNVAMTGEITLRGKVLPIGGLKEKSLAAYRLGIRTVIIPKSNLKDLEEIPEKYRKLIEFVPVSDAEEVFARAIVGFETK